MSKYPVILGIDPGTTAGICIIDINGKIIDLFSKRDLGINEVLKFITEKGIAICIGTDKAKIPQSIRSIASNLGIKVYHPKEDLTSEEKRELINRYEIRNNEKINYKNTHEYDSISCAIFAYTKAYKLLKKIELKQSNILPDNLTEFYKKAFNSNIPLHRLTDLLDSSKDKDDIIAAALIKSSSPKKSPDKINMVPLLSKSFNIENLLRKQIIERNNHIQELKVKLLNNETKIEILRKRIKLLETKDRKNLQRANTNTRKKFEKDKIRKQEKEVLDSILNSNYNIIKIGKKRYELKDSETYRVLNNSELVYKNKDNDVELYLAKIITETQVEKDKRKVDVNNLLEEHKILRKIAKETEMKKNK